MSAEFFYNIYARFSKRGNNLRLRITPFGIIVFSVCLISGMTGINILSSGLYRIFALTLSLILISRLSRIKDFSGISVSVFFDRQYNAGENSKYTVTIINQSAKDLFDLELIPEVERPVPSKEDFISKKEPGEEKRNLWDRNIYYFRWAWHIIKLHKADLPSIRNVSVKHNSFTELDAEIIPVKRGIISFKGMYLTKKDIFGLYTTSIFLPAENRIVILPKPADLNSKLINQLSDVADRKNRSDSFYLLKHKTGDFIGLREYVPGDPMRNIHWKTWARTEKPAVVEKGFEKIKECTVILGNIAQNDKEDTELNFENILSYLYSSLKFFEDNGFEVTFLYLSLTGDIRRFTAEKETGNFHKLYNILSELDYCNITASVFTSKLKRELNPYSRSVMFCVEKEPELARFANGRKITLYNPEECGEVNQKMPEVNLS